MGAIANKTHTIASDVADDGTFTVTYPSGATQAALRGTKGGQMTYLGAVFYQGADPGIDMLFGASTITITNKSGITLAAGTVITLSFGETSRNGSYNLTLGGDHMQAGAGDGSGAVKQTLTATGAVSATTDILEVAHASVVIAATMDVSQHQGLFIVRNTSASGTAAHTLTLTNGTFNGSNTVATLDAPGEALTVFFDSAGRGQVIENTGSVALSGS